MLLTCLTGLLMSSLSSADIHHFDNVALQNRFHGLTYELRCLVCQNQNIADSDADLAKDLRKEVARMLRVGKTDDDIRNFMVARYGEFVLYKPRLRIGTLALWVGPFLILIAALGMLMLHIHRIRRTTVTIPNLTADERKRVEAILAEDAPSGDDR